MLRFARFEVPIQRWYEVGRGKLVRKMAAGYLPAACRLSERATEGRPDVNI